MYFDVWMTSLTGVDTYDKSQLALRVTRELALFVCDRCGLKIYGNMGYVPIFSPFIQGYFG